MLVQILFKPLRLLIFWTLLALCVPVLADSGGVGSGGGGICQTPSINKGYPITLDLALAKKPILDLPNSKYFLPETKVLKNVGLDEFPGMTANEIYKDLRDLQDDWVHQLEKEHDEASAWILRAHIFLLAEVINSQVAPYFMITNQTLPVRNAEIPDSSECVGAAVTGAAIYNRDLVVISQPVWNSLGEKSKLAIVIHEVLRKLQITHELRGSTRDLQDLTRILVMGPKKSKNIHISTHPFFHGWGEQMSNIISQKSFEIYQDSGRSLGWGLTLYEYFTELHMYYGEQAVPDQSKMPAVMELGPQTEEAVKKILPEILEIN